MSHVSGSSGIKMWMRRTSWHLAMQHDLQPHRRGGLALFLQILKHALQEPYLHCDFAIHRPLN